MPMELQNQTGYSQLVLFVVLLKNTQYAAPSIDFSKRIKIEVYLESYLY